MVYNEKFVAVVMSGGKILRERNGGVYLPFGSDYSIRLKNLNIRDAVVDIEIDGTDVLGGSQIVVRAGQTSDIEGFLDDNAVHNAFRFIHKTDETVNHRGDRLDDGTIRITWRWVAEVPEVRHVHHEHHHHDYYHHDYWYPWPQYQPYHPWMTWCGSQSTSGATPSASSCLRGSSVKCSSFSANQTNADEGITVRGEHRSQEFQNVSVGQLETAQHCIVICLRGESAAGEPVRAAITTESRPVCPTCGRKQSSVNSFCSGCGTALG